MSQPFFTLTVQLVLGGVWGLAGLTKLAQGRARADAATEFGLLPPRVAGLVGVMLPYAELALAAAFLSRFRVGLASAVSIVLLILFSAAMAANLARGRQVRCNCFGQLGRSPVSWWSVGRNLALAGLALAAAPATGPSPPPEFLLSSLCAAAVLLGWQLVTSAWGVAATIAAAENGPALGLPERRHLRRWLRVEAKTARRG